MPQYIKENRYRTALTRFRLSSHDLLIETGRYTNIERNNRICINCEMNMIENEYHFLLMCPKYRELREKYIKRYYYTWPNIQKFTNLLCTSSKVIIYNTAKYIYYANRQKRKCRYVVSVYT